MQRPRLVLCMFALTAIGVVAFLKPTKVTGRSIRCLIAVTVWDGKSQPIDPAKFAVINGRDCSDMENMILFQECPFKYLYSVDTTKMPLGQERERYNYYCVEVTPDPDQINSPAPKLSLPGATPNIKYLVTSVWCKDE